MQEVQITETYQNNHDNCLQQLFTHDISNIFNVISNSFELCEIILEQGVNKEELIEFFQLITEQISRGKKLVKNLKSLSTIEDISLVTEPTDLLQNLRDAIRFIKISYPAKSVHISLSSEKSNYSIIANNLLVEVFENLFINSILYNKHKIIKIEISISEISIEERKFVKIECKDNGIGIEDSRKCTILQGNYNRNINSQGLGLGLSLVAKLLKLWGGRIWIEDSIKGDSSKGSNFILMIPQTNSN
ncbi:MAG: HAMP domain-containing sensor histidine kinase [Candidatus Lokiarchaeota archaeon]